MAAMWTTASTSSIARRTEAGWVMSPHRISAFPSRFLMLFRFCGVSKSNTRTWKPSCKRALQTIIPSRPAPPVISTRTSHPRVLPTSYQFSQGLLYSTLPPVSPSPSKERGRVMREGLRPSKTPYSISGGLASL